MSAAPTDAQANPAGSIPFRQPKPWLRWLGVILAAAGWYVSLELAQVSASGRNASGLLHAVCGDAPAGAAMDDCTSVLTSTEAYIQLSESSTALRLPTAVLGMAYFATVLAWYLLVGPASRRGRFWHLLFGLLILAGATYSLRYIWVMHSVLHQWCAGCLLAHAYNGGIVVVTLLAYPWRAIETPPRRAHPSARLALAVGSIGALLLVTHLAWVYVRIAGRLIEQRSAQYLELVSDPEFIRWDHSRQTPADIPLDPDEYFAGNPQAEDTLVVFGDFQCPACASLHDVLGEVLAQYGDRLRIAYRHYPQDAACNDDPKYRAGGHPAACQAARAAEAVRMLAGDDAYAALRNLLYQRRRLLPTVPPARQDAGQRELLATWAAEFGVAREAFWEAAESDAVRDRIARDIALANRLGFQAMPQVLLNGRKVRNWRRIETWDALLTPP
jgi:protein-disulfide isomerase/uncharacterized membrane protein